MWIHVELGWNQLNFELTVLLCTVCGSQEWDLQVFWNHSGPCAVTRSSCVSHVCFLEIRYNFHGLVCFLKAWENSQHFAMPPQVSLQNDVWETSAEIPYWWRVTAPELGSASDWLKQISHAARPIRSIPQIWVVTRHQFGISALVSQTSFHWETSGGIAKCLLFSQAMFLKIDNSVMLSCGFLFEWLASLFSPQQTCKK